MVLPFKWSFFPLDRVELLWTGKECYTVGSDCCSGVKCLNCCLASRASLVPGGSEAIQRALRILSEMFHPEECQLTCRSEACSDLFWDLGFLNAGRILDVGKMGESQPVEQEVLLCSSSDYQSQTLTCCFRKAGTVKPDRNLPFSVACCWGFNSLKHCDKCVLIWTAADLYFASLLGQHGDVCVSVYHHNPRSLSMPFW